MHATARSSVGSRERIDGRRGVRRLLVGVVALLVQAVRRREESLGG
jgi:hypothetical protein